MYVDDLVKEIMEAVNQEVLLGPLAEETLETALSDTLQNHAGETIEE